MITDSQLSSAIRSMLGDKFRVETAPIRCCKSQLFPGERNYIANAVATRQAEFGTARVCARHALAQLGVAPCSLEPYEDRSPRWPVGVKGSISHAVGYCAVAVTNSMDIGGVGIDLEADTPLDESLEMLLCTVDERRRLSQVEPYRRKMLRKVYFCAKEAFYKCQYETTRAMLNFTDVEIEICPESDEFVVKRIHKPGAQWLRFQQVVGMFRELDGCIVGTAVLPLTAVSVRDNS